MKNKPLPEEAATSNDQVQNTKSPPVPSSERPTEEFITDNAAAISELLQFRAAYTAGARKIAIIPSTRDEYSHFQAEESSCSYRNNTSDNTSNVPKSLVKRETRKRATVDEDGFRLPPKKQTANPNGKPFLSSPAAILTHPNSSAPSAPPIILFNAYEEVEEIEFDNEQAAAAVAPRVKIPPFFIQPNPDWTDLMGFAYNLAPTLQKQNPDLLLVQETKLQSGLDPLIANYRLHKDDRNNFPRTRTDGGTAICCKNNYDHNRVSLPTLQYMDATAIEIKFNNFPLIRIVSAYARSSPENNRKFPDKDFLKIRNSGQNIIIAGDLNAAHPKIRHRNRIRKFWQRTRDPAVKSEFRTLSREVTKDIRHFFQSRWESHIKALTPETANHPLEKAEVIADSLQKQFEPNTEAENDRFTARTQRKIKRFLDAPTCLDLEKTTPGEVQEYIKKLKINKSPGLDLITNRILKNLPLKFVLFIVMLFNLLMENCHFPKNWKTA
ncbi:RNA-directed DNA polymerase from mobile element jockey [Trichonephila clavipes]|nr:RNA-directed DNA polymerase from mobile element jockey [Trichonephila clavipes]